MNSKKPYELEICIDSLESAIAAQHCGADRVELCGRLDLDGLTPDIDLIQQCRDSIDIELHVMIRPEAGDFTADSRQLDLMLKSIRQCLAMGVDGVVFGILNNNKGLDVSAISELLSTAGNMNVTFHRAFDVCKDPFLVLDQLIQLGIYRLLTSGQKETAIEGIDLIQELSSKSGQEIGIMVGSGVNASNIPQFWKLGIRQFHFTSHMADANGKLIFDPSKTLAAKSVLDKLCDT